MSEHGEAYSTVLRVVCSPARTALDPDLIEATLRFDRS
jgi:hypothetical protein